MMKWLRKLFGMKDELKRQRMLFVSKRELPKDTFAIVRLSWFTKEGVYDVSEIKLIYEDESAEEMIPQFAMIVGEALRGGADVSILTDIDPELLGII